MTVIWTILGLLLLVLLFVDVFLTVFKAQGQPGPVTRAQTRALWAIASWMGRGRGDEVRPGVLALAAPLMVLLTLLAWVLCLTVGFAFIYLPWIQDFLVSTGELRTPWIEAFYYSGYTAATLGFGDLVPDAEVLRVLAPIQAFSGFALISVSTTYLLATYRELILMRTAALKIAIYFDASGIHSPQFEKAGGYEAMANWTEDTSDMMMRTIQAHFQYPILHYFRPSRDDWALPVQLGRILDLREASHAAKDDEGASAARHHPSFLVLFATVDEYLEDVDRHFMPRSGRSQANGGEQYSRETHDRLMKYMMYR